VAPNPGLAVETAMERARWEHMANGFRSVIGGLREDLGEVPPRIATGYHFDTVVWSGLALADAQSWDSSFQSWFGKLNLWGFPPATVAELLGAPRVVEEVMDDLRTAFRGSAQRPGPGECTYIAHQNRFGSAATSGTSRFSRGRGRRRWISRYSIWREACRSPSCRAFLVKDFLIRLHPDLATIPVDGNAPEARPSCPGCGTCWRITS
jgi:hypothetical protein